MKYTERLFSLLAGVSLLVVFVVVLAQVVQRYVFNISLPWATDVIRVAFIYSIFLGMTLGVVKKMHLSIDFLLYSFPVGWRPFFDILSNIVTFIFLFAVLVYSIPFIQRNMDQTMPYLDLSMGWVYCVIPLGAVVMLCSLAADTIRIIVSRQKTKEV